MSNYLSHLPSIFLFFFNDTATTEIYTLSLHDALPILTTNEDAPPHGASRGRAVWDHRSIWPHSGDSGEDRKSTRLNSSHVEISYAVFCLKKKKKIVRLKVKAESNKYE